MVNAETMNRNIYVSKIKSLLSLLKSEIQEGGKLNLLDTNVHAEDFFRDLLNLVYGWQLRNMNQWNQNAAGGDLWYENGKLVIQVTSTCKKEKIQSSIDKLEHEQFNGYRFKFLRIDGDVRKLRKDTYKTPAGIAFDPQSDIIDFSSLLSNITHLDIDSLKAVSELCVKEIAPYGSTVITETDLVVVVKALASNVTDWKNHPRPIEFDVDKKIIFNHLETKSRLINEYKLYIGKLNAVYKEYLNSGVDYSFIILQNLSDSYSQQKDKFEGDELFDAVVKDARDMAANSSSAAGIPLDRMNICIYVIVVDAFIRCRIFEDPEGYSYVDA